MIHIFELEQQHKKRREAYTSTLESIQLLFTIKYPNEMFIFIVYRHIYICVRMDELDDEHLKHSFYILLHVCMHFIRRKSMNTSNEYLEMTHSLTLSHNMHVNLITFACYTICTMVAFFFHFYSLCSIIKATLIWSLIFSARFISMENTKILQTRYFACFFSVDSPIRK